MEGLRKVPDEEDKGYAEVLENTQLVLIAMVQKLYSMLRNDETWEFGEPELNDRGEPVVHNVASKLGCLRPNSDLDLPTHSIFPEDEAGMAELARQLQDQAAASGAGEIRQTSRQKTESCSIYNQTDRANSSAKSDAEDSNLDCEPDYRRAAFGAASAVNMSLSSLGYADFDISPPSAVLSDGFPPNQHSPTVSQHTSTLQWSTRPPSMDFAAQKMWMAGQGYMETDRMNWGVLASNFAIKGQEFSSSCRNSEVMMGMGDPMIYAGYEDDTLRPLSPS
ncbi:hypothetical protein NEMBOFW57_004035 [Staphylotrichum longicolle]|uniref:Uncharacterized protein n=1 Tax=Staphylotrichum longicolle TaxID=669026 RepID=A0AAD4I028_9PEZI|nr:hypothetical protein NEMBOFW57_004035 [Staphylotrichum longicolle]